MLVSLSLRSEYISTELICSFPDLDNESHSVVDNGYCRVVGEGAVSEVGAGDPCKYW